MRYYLDTNAVWMLKSKLKDIREFSFTSIFTVFELLAGIDKEAYHERKDIISRLFEAELDIDQRMPIELISQSFLIDQKIDTITFDDLKAIGKELTESSSFEDFEQRCKKLQPDFNWLRFFDQSLSNQFKKIFVEKTDLIKEQRKIVKKASFTPDRRKGIEALVSFLLEKQIPQYVSSSTEVAARYNGKIDPFIAIWLKYYDKNANLLNKIALNDWADILHTTYLGSGVILVTQDKKIRKLINDVIPDAAISVDEFRAKCS